MDLRQWDVQQYNTSAHHKRSRDVESTSTGAFTALSGYNNHLRERDPPDEHEWKRRRHSSQPNANLWDTNIQTTLWLAQQNSLAPVASMCIEDNSQPCQANEPEQVLSRDDKSLNRAPSWSRRVGETDTGHGQEGPHLGTRDFSRPANANQSSERAHETRNDMPGTTAPQPRRPSNIAEIDHRCEKCYQAEPLIRDSAASLSRLVDSLTLGPVADVLSQARRDGLPHDQTPHLLELHRIIDLLQEANEITAQVLRGASSSSSSSSYLHNVKKESSLQANDIHTSLESMKRRFLADSQDVLERQHRRSSDLNSNVEAHDYQPILPDPSIPGESSGRLSTIDIANNDVLPPIRSQSPSHPSSDGYGTRLPSMKPPPTPGRQLPSPPGRSHPSPPSYNMPSPSPTYPQSVVSTSVQPSHPSLANILHPLSPTPSSSLGTSTAIQAHTAALQHEVSVKKYALQTLQGEHDKLLAALRRSQTRARALEEKQVASDLEINTLAEERVRLLTQVQELEQSIVDISKSRDEFRQAAVKGGAQYVKIVRMASQLEMMAGEERREWKRKLEENKETIDALRENAAAPRGLDGNAKEFKTLPSREADTEDELRKEVQRLRARCAEIENALKNIRIESQRFGEAIATLGTAGARISDSVSSVWGDPSASLEARAPPSLPSEEEHAAAPTGHNGEV